MNDEKTEYAVTASFSCPTELLEKVDRQAEKENRTRSNMLQTIIEKFFERK